MNFFSSLLSLDYTVIALISAFMGALSNILARVMMRNMASKDILGMSFLLMGVTMLLFSPLFFFFKPNWEAIQLLFLIGFIDGAANYFYFKAFESANDTSFVSTILSTSPAFAFFGAWLVMNDTISPLSLLLCVGLIIVSIILSTGIKNVKSFSLGSLWPAFVAAILFGISSVPSKVILQMDEVINPATLYLFRAVIIGLLTLISFRPNMKFLTGQKLTLIWFRGLFVIVTWILLYTALKVGHAGVTMTLANTTSTFVVFLGAVLLREKITLKKVVLVSTVFLFSYLILKFS